MFEMVVSKGGRASGCITAFVRLLLTAGVTVMGMTAACFSAADDCSGPYVEGASESDIWIPDDGSGWAVSEILIQGAPQGSRVRCVEVHYEIIHPYVGDLVVELANEDVGAEYRLWDNEGKGADSIDETETGITVFNEEIVNRVWLLRVNDTAAFSDEGFIDSWWIKVYYEDSKDQPENDGCGDATELTEGELFSGSTKGASGSLESSCALGDTADVWYSYTPSGPELVKINLISESFDTTLAVYDACGGTELVCSDDVCDEPDSETKIYTSEIMMNMLEGTTYFVRVAGYQGKTGDYEITATKMNCVLSPVPTNPAPVDGETDVAVDSPLSWNGKRTDDVGTRSALVDPENFTVTSLYGQDDRKDEYEVTDPALLAVGDSTFAVVLRSDLSDNGDGTFSLPAKTLAEWYKEEDPISTGSELCNSERFRNQPNPAIGSGFLIAPDIIATAGHLACDTDCTDTAYVFGLVMRSADMPVLRVQRSEVYYCSEIIARDMGMPDWAIIRLDREVTGHKPLRFRTDGVINDDERLFVIGHPLGLLRKYAGGATVRENTASAYFLTNLDSYGGNSGSPVFNARTLEVEGILYAGPAWSFVPDGRCDRSLSCPDTGCPVLIYVTRSTEFAPLLGNPKYDVYMGRTDPPSELVYESIADPTCEPAEKLGTLQPCTTYFWQVVSKGPCNRGAGPVWSFTTGSVAADLDGDCRVDFKDFARLASYWLETEPSVDIVGTDGKIDFSDVAAVAECWLVGPAK